MGKGRYGFLPMSAFFIEKPIYKKFIIWRKSR